MPLAMLQEGLDVLYREGAVDVDVDTLGHRSAFVGAVLLTLPDTVLEPTTPPRIVLGSKVREQVPARRSW